MAAPPSRTSPNDGRAGIDAKLVRQLVATQFPQWGDLAIAPVEVDGWDNRTYRLGDELTVRLPTAAGYVAAVEKEDRWLPTLADQLPLPVPEPVATGKPGEGYPFPWSIRRWIPGHTARPDRIDDPVAFAAAVAEFLLALQAVDPTGGPTAGEHSFHRGASPAHYDQETRNCLSRLRGHIDTDAAAEVWQAALDARWGGRPVWFHGDIAHGNLLVVDGKLSAVIDFGTSGVGDPACDLVLAWTMCTEQSGSRQTFRELTGQDRATWARARGWALWKAMLVLTMDLDDEGAIRPEDADEAAEQHRVIDEVLADHRRHG